MNRLFYISIAILGLLASLNLTAQVYRDSSDCSDQLSRAWVKTAGANDVDAVNDICTDESGNIYITGFFSNDMTFQTITVNSTGFKDFYVAKLDSDGNLLWIETGGSAQDDEGTGIALDENDNIYVTGNFGGTATFGTDSPFSNGNKDIFLLKYSNSGVYQWGEFIGGFDNDIAGDVCVDNSNNPIITGTYYFAMSIDGSSYVGAGAEDFFIAKYNSSGDFQWVTSEGSVVDDSGVKIACDNLNNLYVTGEFSGTLDFGPIDIIASGANDVFLAKYSSNGGFVWAVKAGTGGDSDKAGDVVVSSDSKIYLSLKLDQVADQGRVYIYQNNGIFGSEIAYGGSGTIQSYGLAVDYSGAAYVSGMYSGLTDFGDGDVNVVGGSDYFVAKYKSDGTFAFKDVAGSNYLDCGTSLCLDNSSNLIVGGYCNNGIYFDATPYAAEGKEDNMIVKYDSYFAFESIDITSIDCDPNNMCVDIVVAGGTGTLDYYWGNGATSQNVCGLSVGDIQIIVTDDNDCYIETTVSVVAPTATPIDWPLSVPACFHDTITLDAGDYDTFIWSPGNEDTQTIDVYNGGTFSVTVTDNSSCTTSASIEVIEGPDEDLIALDTIYICSEVPTTINVPGYTDYWWSSGSTAATYATSVDGEHSLYVYDGTCYYFDTIEIINFPKPSIDLGGDQDVCEGDSVMLEVVGDEFESYLWQDNSTESYFWASQTTSIMIVATDTNSCVTTDAIEVTLVPTEEIELGPNASYCTSIPIVLDPHDTSIDNTYLWSNTLTTGTILVNETGQYWINVTNSFGCVSTDTITLTIYEQPVVDLGEDISFCEGGSDTIRVIGDYITYVWNNGTDGDYVYVTESGLFSVTATDANGCFDSDTIIVFESNLESPFLGYDTTLCVGDIYLLQPMDDYYRYNWHNGTMGSYLTITEPGGTYSLTVTDEVGCTSSSTISIDYAEVPFITNVEAAGGQIVIEAAGGTEPYVYSYDGDTWQSLHVFTLLPSDYYTVSVMDKNYCMVSFNTFLDASIGVPNFFTPNGDGFNDYWIISGLYQYPGSSVQVYDRYGKLLYAYSEGGQGWNGYYAGRRLPSDTYWYVINLENGRRPITGHVTIKR